MTNDDNGENAGATHPRSGVSISAISEQNSTFARPNKKPLTLISEFCPPEFRSLAVHQIDKPISDALPTTAAFHPAGPHPAGRFLFSLQ